jgi:hypothetical protein
MSYKEAISKGLKFGDSIDEAAYNNLIALNADLAASFVKTVDGYTYLGDKLSSNIPIDKIEADLNAIEEAEKEAQNL